MIHSKRLVLAVALSLAFRAHAAKEKEKTPGKPDVAADIDKPRADARKVTFTEHEGTWMSVDVSPDGKTLVFDLLGDIYTLPIGGGAAKALTQGPAWDFHPRFSPDGKTIAFTSDRGGMENVWLMNADGTSPHALTEEKDAYVRSAAWTPDGQYLVTRKEDAKRAGIPPVELWLYHREGGSGVKLTSSDDANNASGPVVSKDGRFIFYAVREKRFSYTPDLSNGLWKIERYDRTTGETYPLTGGIGGAVRPAVSPDGKTLVFVSRRDDQSVLVARDLGSGTERILLSGVTRDEQEGFAALDTWPNYAFTPDGGSLVFENHGKLVRLDVASGKTSDIPFTAEVVQWFAPRVIWQEKLPTGPVEARILRWTSQSPDGRWILFDAFGKIYLQEIAGGKAVGAPRRLTPDRSELPTREYAPSFSRDGKWIAYVTWSDADGGHVWKAAVPGSSAPADPVRLTTTSGHFVNPEFSPKGDRLVVLRGSGLEKRGQQPEEEEYFDIVVLDAAPGAEAHFVTTVKPANSMKFHPHAFFSADGARILYKDPIERKKPTEDPKNDLVSVRLDGTDKKHLLRFPASSDLEPSPTGEWVAFTSRDNVYVVALPRVLVKEPPEIGLKESPLPTYRLSDEAGSWVGWADGGKTVTWSLANVFHRLPLQSAIDFANVEKRKAEEKAKAEARKGEKTAQEKKADASKVPAKKDEEKKDEPHVAKSEAIEIRIERPRATPAGTFALKGARVVTMKGDEVLENANVVVTGNRITAIGKDAAIPAGAKMFDAAGKTIIPGLVDTHAHLHYAGFELFPDTKWEYVANLAYGVTTVYDPSAPSLDTFAQAEMVEAGLMVGPRVYSSGDVLYGGHQEDVFAEVENQNDARRQVKRMKAWGARMIKVYQQPRRSQRLWLAEACREEHVLLTAEGAGELQTDMTMALDGFTAWEHALPVRISKDVVDLVAKSGTTYTPTLIVAYGGENAETYFYQERNPHDDARLRRFVPHRMLDGLSRRHRWVWPSEYNFPSVAEGAAEVLRAGGHVSLGAHGQLQGLGVHWEVWAMAGEGGRGKAMTPHEALRASTILAAEKIGFEPDLGSIETGKLADFVVLDANPLEDIHNSTKIRWVVKNGALFEADGLKQILPEERALPPFFWQEK